MHKNFAPMPVFNDKSFLAGKLNPSSADLSGIDETSWRYIHYRWRASNGVYPASAGDQKVIKIYAPVAQLDRASDYGSEGLGFESLRVYQ